MHGHAMLQQEGADLVDNAGTLTDQSLTDAVERLESTCSVIFVATISNRHVSNPAWG